MEVADSRPLWQQLGAITLLTLGLIAATGTGTKYRLYARAVVQWLTRYDDPAAIPPPVEWPIDGPGAGPAERTIRVVFIRHGHSTTNGLGHLRTPEWLGWVWEFLRREVLWAWAPLESVWLDAALTDRGLGEAHELCAALGAREAGLRYDTGSTALVVSNVRRALETALTGLGAVRGAGDSIAVDPSLCEVNDLSFLDAPDTADFPPVRIRHAKQRATHRGYDAVTTTLPACGAFSPTHNTGNHAWGEHVWRRQDTFVKRLFGIDPEHGHLPAGGKGGNAAVTQAVVVGHSGWFLRFFKRHMPGSNHELRRRKLENCAAVAFDLKVVADPGSNTAHVEVCEESIEYLHRRVR